MLEPKDARFRDAWEDGVAPRWKDAPDDPKYGFGKDRTRFRVCGMTFLGHAGLCDVYLGALGDINNPGIQFCHQAADGFLIGDRWISCSCLDEIRRAGTDDDDPAYAANLFASLLRLHAMAVPGIPVRPDPMKAAMVAAVTMLRQEYARIAGIVPFPPSLGADPDPVFVAAAPGRPAKHRTPFGPTDAMRFIGTVGDLDVWQDGNVHPSDHVRLVAVEKDGPSQGYMHDVRRNGSCVPLGSPRWAQAVVDWLVRRADPKPAAAPIREPESSGVLCGVASDDDLVAALKESEWYPRFAESTKGVYPDSPRHLRSFVMDRRTGTGYTPTERTLLGEMLAIIDEITSWRIYGSRENCAVCGQCLAIHSWKWTEANGTIRWVHCHSGACCDMDMDRHPEGLSAAAAILRARRLLVENGGAVAPVGDFRFNFKNGTSPAPGDKIVDRSGHGNDLTTKPGNPLPCAGCGKPSTRPLGKFLICDECNNLLRYGLRDAADSSLLTPERFAEEADKRGEQMLERLRDSHQRHGLFESACRVYAGRFGHGAPTVVCGKSSDDIQAERERSKDAENRMIDAMGTERSEEAKRRYHASCLRTEAECRAVRERMIQENVPAWLDPRRK